MGDFIANNLIKTFPKLEESDDIKNFANSGQIKELISSTNEMINSLKDGDFYNFVSYHFDPLDKTYHMIFRYYSEKYGLDYHDYRILSNGEALIIDDVFVYSSSQKLY